MKLNKPVVSVLAGLTILYPNAAEAAENGINEPENSVYELELETELNSEQGFEDKDNTDQLIDEQNVEKEQSAEMTDSEVVEDGKGDIKEDIKVEKNNKLEESNNDKVLEEPISTQSEVTTFAINELKPGVSSPRVKQMKEDLAKLGFVVSANPNNDYGPQTAAVVKEFQQYYGLEATGVADETTLNKIDKVLSSPYQYGNSSAEIKQLKLKLAKLGYVVSNNPNEDFGPSTREIVRSFQRDQGLRINGIIDEVTLNKIDELLGELEGPLKPGMSNPLVKQMKEDLAKLGFVVSANPNNDYGPQTAAVVKEFQQYYGLEATGVADEATLNKIHEVLSSPYQLYHSSPEIKKLKMKLLRLGFVVSNNPNEDYGLKTAEVVKEFQKTFGLRVNGIIDEVTLNKINELFDNKFVINRVYYDITLDQAVKIQLEAPGTPPQTDKYRNDPAYVSGSYISVYDGGNISGSSVNIRTSPKLGTNDNIFATVGNGEKFIVLNNNVEGDEFNGSKKWYKILYNNKEVYVHSTLATIGSKVGLVKDEVNVRSKPNTSGHIFGKAKKNDILTVVKQENNGWYEVKYTTWRNATADDVRQYLDPENFVNNEIQMFQFLDLTKPSGVSVAKLNEYLKGKGVLEGMGAAFQEAARQHGINDLYLVSHALLETGNGTSQLARGINVNGKTVYNVYGIGAIDEDPDKYGSQKAYEEGWTSVEKAIIGGAAFIGNDYIKAGQNTLYKMRWNPDSMASHGVASHQYATDIGWASKQLNNLYNLYKYVGDYQLQLEVPVYKK
ncbi:peptidoglycan-binding protein [Pallidibacillus thermolactis]|uniref:peptidoglycan-binding protein n=1 Tax=Pallidibacillus thermolactis TaxID=251051 RepID=UPI002E1A587B|nr:peptidoglycan-binding protein [Pallidibacillus thermolactis subsp. kokeshiiformis]